LKLKLPEGGSDSPAAPTLNSYNFALLMVKLDMSLSSNSNSKESLYPIVNEVTSTGYAVIYGTAEGGTFCGKVEFAPHCQRRIRKFSLALDSLSLRA
jgi:hypothetical protein